MNGQKYMFKEYGGYIEFETFHGALLHNGAVALNCGRSALAYLCEAKSIKKLYVPYYLCSTVSELCEKMNISYEYYYIKEDFFPLFNKKLVGEEWIYIVNYYGQIKNEQIIQLQKKLGNIIVDNAQSYYQMPVDGIDTLYTCRKYFGVADGAFLYTDTRINRCLEFDESFNKMNFLLGRFEKCASEFYDEYVENNKRFKSEPIKKMSKLTMNLLRGIDYSATGTQRMNNFKYLNDALCSINQLRLDVPYGAFMYPLLIRNGANVRKRLQEKKVYVPMLWPNVAENTSMDSLEYRYATDILPIPVDHRYDEQDMKYIVEVIKECIA